MTAMSFLILCAAIGLLYPLFLKFLLRLTENTRLELADLGRELLQAHDISEEHKEFISNMLDDVFSWKFMAFATFAFPVSVFRGGKSTRLSDADKAFVRREDVGEFMDLHMKSVMAVSPIWTIAFFFVALVTLVIALFWIGLSAISYLWADTVRHVSPSIHSDPNGAGRFVH